VWQSSDFLYTLKTISRASGKSLGWNILSVVGSLLQVIIIIGYAHYKGNQVAYDRILKDGIILFFCSAFLASTVVDYWFTEELKIPIKLIEGLFIYVLPLGLIGFITSLYSAILLPNDSGDMDEILQATKICFILTVVHSFIYRSISFYFRRER